LICEAETTVAVVVVEDPDTDCEEGSYDHEGDDDADEGHFVCGD